MHPLVVLGRPADERDVREPQDEHAGPVVGGRGDVRRASAEVAGPQPERVGPPFDDAGAGRRLHASAGVTRTGSSVTSSPSMRKLRSDGASSCWRLTMA